MEVTIKLFASTREQFDQYLITLDASQHIIQNIFQRVQNYIVSISLHHIVSNR